MSDPRDLYLVSTEWLHEHIDDPSLRIVDVTAMLTKDLKNLARDRVYDEGHIPGSGFLDMASGWGALSDPHAEHAFTWPSIERVEAAMSEIGVSNDTRVIVYAGSPRSGVDFGPMWASRTWWVLHHFGVDCAVLDGGYEKWVSEQRPLTKESAAPRLGTFTASSDGLHAIATKQEVLAATENAASCILDALSVESYTGAKPLPSVRRKGHITGAVNVPMYTLLDQKDGTYANDADLAAKFEAAGINLRSPIITYCGGGIAATMDAFALRLLKAADARVYDGSLSEWTADEALPMSISFSH